MVGLRSVVGSGAVVVLIVVLVLVSPEIDRVQDHTDHLTADVHQRSCPVLYEIPARCEGAHDEDSAIDDSRKDRWIRYGYDGWAVDDDTVVATLQRLEEGLEPVALEKLGRIGRYGTRWDNSKIWYVGPQLIVV